MHRKSAVNIKQYLSTLLQNTNSDLLAVDLPEVLVVS